MRLSRILYRAARTSRDVEALRRPGTAVRRFVRPILEEAIAERLPQ